MVASDLLSQRSPRLFRLACNLQVVIDAEDAWHYVGPHSSDSQIAVVVHDARQGDVAVLHDDVNRVIANGGSLVIPPAALATDGPLLGPPRLDVYFCSGA